MYYNNFASHLLCAYNPNMYHPGLPYRWSDEDWRRLVDMIAGFSHLVSVPASVIHFPVFALKTGSPAC